MEFQRLEPLAEFCPQAASASGEDHAWIGVPPQLSETRPSGTEPPRALKTSRPKNQATAEKEDQSPRPTEDGEAGAHGTEIVAKSLRGCVGLEVPWPMVRRRMEG